MTKVAKKRAKVDVKVDELKLYALQEAMELAKQVNTAKFDASVDIHIRLGIDPRKADQALRGTVALPHGTGKTKTVLVFCKPEKEAEATAAGAGAGGRISWRRPSRRVLWRSCSSAATFCCANRRAAVTWGSRRSRWKRRPAPRRRNVSRT